MVFERLNRKKPRGAAMKSEYGNLQGASPLPLEQFLSFGVAICGALEDLHTKDDIHADIRPHNIQ
jgi:hypothetical protein